MDINLSPALVSAVPLVMLVTSYSKNYVESKWSPIVCLILSLITSFLFLGTGTIQENIVQGILLAVTASGLYSGGKSIGNAVSN